MASAHTVPTTPQGSSTDAALRARSLCHAPRRVLTFVVGTEAGASPEIPPHNPLAPPTSQPHASSESPPRASWTLNRNTPNRRLSGFRALGGGDLRAEVVVVPESDDDDLMAALIGSSGVDSCVSDLEGHISPQLQQLRRSAGSSPLLLMATHAKRRRLASERVLQASPRDFHSQFMLADACTSSSSSSSADVGPAPNDLTVPPISCTSTTREVLDLSF